MQKSLSIYLHLVRFAAAVAVVLSHANYFFFPVLSNKIAGHGSEAVAIFFVLSGFMMRHVTEQKENELRRYAMARLTRIFSVVPLAIVVGIVADTIGRGFDPSRYHQIFADHGNYSLATIVASLLFVNEIWYNHFVIGTNEAYWSLGFEVQYYIAFAMLVFVGPRRRAVMLAIWAVFVGPKVLLYLPLWALGVVGYDIIRRWGRDGDNVVSRRAGLSIFLASAVAYLVFRFGLHQDARSLFRTESYREMAHIAVHFYVVGLLFTANVVGFALAARDIEIWPEALATPIKWLAGGSFTLYLTHEPLLVAVSAIWPRVHTSRPVALLAIGAVVAVSYLYAEFGERRKVGLQSVLRVSA